MWKRLTRAYQKFADDKPGHRFLNAHERSKKRGNSLFLNLGYIVAGLALIVIGILLGLVPGVPGIVLGVLGLALIATRFRWMAIGLDVVEVKCRGLGRQMLRDQRIISKAFKNAMPLPP